MMTGVDSQEALSTLNAARNSPNARLVPERPTFRMNEKLCRSASSARRSSSLMRIE